ncbi:hypothetical protein Tco_0492728 [Tanacetum coccineum]
MDVYSIPDYEKKNQNVDVVVSNVPNYLQKPSLSDHHKEMENLGGDADLWDGDDLEERRAEQTREARSILLSMPGFTQADLWDDDVKINNELFEATVQEIGSWCIKIIDDYIDLSSNDNIKDADTSSESIDNHSVDDLEYIQTNLNNIDNQAESSDLSRPPGFEFMKKSSSPSSKCSTSFARFRKKDIKGVSLIHELNQIIDVGNSLGYDLKGIVKEL